MSVKIQTPPTAGAVTGATTTAAAISSEGAEKKAHEDAAKVGRDFEAILVRQMLGQAKVAGKGGYADMAVESLAASVTQAGGLGMGRAIEEALTSHRRHVSAGAKLVTEKSTEEAQDPAPTSVR